MFSSLIFQTIHEKYHQAIGGPLHCKSLLSLTGLNQANEKQENK
jgi:hypothetical protein